VRVVSELLPIENRADDVLGDRMCLPSFYTGGYRLECSLSRQTDVFVYLTRADLEDSCNINDGHELDEVEGQNLLSQSRVRRGVSDRGR
jgi:hypothetical protein